jgi:hypothetical protein
LSLRSASFAPMYAMQVKQMLCGRPHWGALED